MKSGLTLSAFWMAKKRSKNTYIPIKLISAKGSMMYHPPSMSSCRTFTSTSVTSGAVSTASVAAWSKRRARVDCMDGRIPGFERPSSPEYWPFAHLQPHSYSTLQVHNAL